MRKFIEEQYRLVDKVDINRRINDQMMIWWYRMNEYRPHNKIAFRAFKYWLLTSLITLLQEVMWSIMNPPRSLFPALLTLWITSSISWTPSLVNSLADISSISIRSWFSSSSFDYQMWKCGWVALTKPIMWELNHFARRLSQMMCFLAELDSFVVVIIEHSSITANVAISYWP